MTALISVSTGKVTSPQSPCTVNPMVPSSEGCHTSWISGLMMLATIALTTAVNAAPMTTATARSMTFPRRMNSLNPLITVSPSGLGGRSRARRCRGGCALGLR